MEARLLQGLIRYLSYQHILTPEPWIDAAPPKLRLSPWTVRLGLTYLVGWRLGHTLLIFK